MGTVVPLNGMRACAMKEDRDSGNGVDEERKERKPRISEDGGERNGGEVKKNDRAHPVRFSDKISNLKFHRNFTILGSKLIVLSARYLPSYLCATLCHLNLLRGRDVSSSFSRDSNPPRHPSPPPLPPSYLLVEPPVRERNFFLKISSLLLITRHHPYRKTFLADSLPFPLGKF